MDTIKTITDWAGEMFNLLPAPFTVFAVIIAGYVMRLVPAFPNKWIPLCCVLIGTAVFCVLNERPESVGEVKFYLRSVFIGAALGMLAWLGHERFISKWEDRIPFLGKRLVKTGDDKMLADEHSP